MFIIMYVTLTISLYMYVILFTVIIMVRPVYIKVKPVQRLLMLIKKATLMYKKKRKKKKILLSNVIKKNVHNANHSFKELLH